MSANCTQNADCPELNIESRIRLYGRKSTVREIIDEIVRLALGDTRRHQAPLNNIAIAAKIGISREYVGTLIKVAINHKLVEVGDNGKIKKPEIKNDFYKFDDDSFAQDTLVKEWIDDLLHKKDGKPKKTWKQDYHSLKNFCNTFKTKPEQLIVDKKTYLEILKNAKDSLDAGTVIYDRANKGIKKSGDGTFHRMKMATRNFVQFHGISLPRNIGGIASGKVIGHGQYADVRLTDEEIERAENYIIEKYGLDSDIFRIFTVGVETGARASALMNIKCEWEEVRHPKTDKVVFVMKAYETKTESNWKKYISRPRTQESLLLHKAKKEFPKIVSTVHTTNQSSQIYTTLKAQLREVYKFLGKEFVHDGYFMGHPFHALRHISAQYYIRQTKGHLTAVTFFCGWKSEIELRASYGELPPEIILQHLPSYETRTATA